MVTKNVSLVQNVTDLNVQGVRLCIYIDIISAMMKHTHTHTYILEGC